MVSSDVSPTPPPRAWFVEAGVEAGFVEAPTAVQAVEVMGHLIRADLQLDVHAAGVRLVDVDQVHLPRRTVGTIVATLRQVAGWIQDPDATMLRETAETLERWDWTEEWDALCCPMCEEVKCDEDCPLAEVRSRAARPR